jgi:hypothetical protein
MDYFPSIMQPKMSTQDKIVNALPFVAFIVICAVGLAFLLTSF